MQIHRVALLGAFAAYNTMRKRSDGPTSDAFWQREMLKSTKKTAMKT
jgi:hypothetical protein